MNLLNIENVSKSYSEDILLENVRLGINEGDKIGLIGRNGTGKTTLLKIITGLERPDTGRVVKGSTINIEYLPQNIEFDPNATISEQVFKGNSENMILLRKYQEAIGNPETSDDHIIKLSQEMDKLDAWNLESEAKSVLTKLGVTDFQAKIGELSGGQKKRVALAGALINPADILILDEPTNHLDNNTIDWLEEYLRARKDPLIMITHDRYFLDRVVNQIVELDGGKLYSYKGNYNNYLQRKLEREEIDAASEQKRKSLMRKELAWMKQGAKARSTKQKARIHRFNELSEKPTDISQDKLDISVASTRLGRKVIELENINKSFDKKLIKDFTYTVLRDDRIGILGPNGSGKSTLINIIARNIEPDSGRVDIGETVKIGLFSQETSHINDEMRVLEYIKEGGEYLKTADGSRITASQMLERFLFPLDGQWTPIGKLSGGEKRRLHLLRVLMEAPNVLLLDEPTNDLDIDTLTILEDYLEEFLGAVIVVSHDRYFLDKIVEKVFVFEGQGKVVEHTGNYSEFKEENSEREEKLILSEKKNKKPEKERPRDRTLKFSYNEQREYDEIDDIILELEEDIEEIDINIEGAATDYMLLEELLVEKKELENQLEEKMERWMYLNELAEKIEEGRTI